jgi:hypothetical protein
LLAGTTLRRIRRLPASLLTAAAVAVLASGCGESKTSEATTPAAPSTATTAVDTGGIDPLDGAGTTTVSAPARGEGTALLERVALARHEGYDRVVFQFRNRLPGYRVGYVEPPLREDGSGNRVELAGDAFVVVRMEPASGFDLSVPEGKLVYEGPRRLKGADAGTSTVQELARVGDFEAVLGWAVGLGDPVDFRVSTLDGPPRLVVDFRNH